MKRIKSFQLFETFDEQDDVYQITNTVKEMLLELDFLDIEKRVDIVRNHSKLQIEQSPEIIVINLWKKAIKIEGDYHYKPSYTWDDIKDVIVPVIDYLEVEGFIWQMDKGTLAYNECPIITTSGSVQFDTIKSKVEMWFIR